MSNQLKALFEIFDEVEKAKTKQDKIKALHNNSSATLKTFLGYVFDPQIKWLVPPGTPPYEPSKEDENLLRGRIYQDFRLLQHFVSTGPYPDMKQVKRENMFISLLQTLHPREVELLLAVKDHRAPPQKSVTKKLIAEAFPNLAKNW